MILPLKNVEDVDKEKGFCFGYSGLVIVIRGHEELFFEFGQPEMRDDCAVTLLRSLDAVRHLQESGVLSQEEKESADVAKAEHRLLQEARQEGLGEHDLKLPQSVESVGQLNDASASESFSLTRSSHSNRAATDPIRRPTSVHHQFQADSVLAGHLPDNRLAR